MRRQKKKKAAFEKTTVSGVLLRRRVCCHRWWRNEETSWKVHWTTEKDEDESCRLAAFPRQPAIAFTQNSSGTTGASNLPAVCARVCMYVCVCVCVCTCDRLEKPRLRQPLQGVRASQNPVGPQLFSASSSSSATASGGVGRCVHRKKKNFKLAVYRRRGWTKELKREMICLYIVLEDL